MVFYCIFFSYFLYPFGLSIGINKIIRCKYLTFYFYCASFPNEIIKCFYINFFLASAFTHLNGIHRHFMMHLKTLFRAFGLCARRILVTISSHDNWPSPIVLTGKAIFQFKIFFLFSVYPFVYIWICWFSFFVPFYRNLPNFMDFLSTSTPARVPPQQRLTERSINHKSVLQLTEFKVAIVISNKTAFKASINSRLFHGIFRINFVPLTDSDASNDSVSLQIICRPLNDDIKHFEWCD